MPPPFVSMVLVERLPLIESGAILSAVKSKVGSDLGDISLVESEGSKNAGEAVVLKTDAGMVTVMFVTSPVPDGTLNKAAHTNVVWRDAGQVLGGHKGHIIVANLGGDEGLKGALFSARLVSLVTASLFDLAPALGIYWSAGDAVSPPDQFAKSVSQMDRQWPLDIWLQLGFYSDGPVGEKGSATGLVTTGLAPFVGREIDFIPTNASPVMVAQRVIGTASCLLQTGTVFKDGETLGISETEKIAIRLVEGDVPLYQLSLSKGE